MKKAVSFILAAAMLLCSLSFVACNKKSPYELVTEAVKNTLALSEIDAKIDEEVTQKLAGVSQTVTSDIFVTAKGFSGTTPEYLAKLSATTSGVTTEVGIYFKDNMYYLDAVGQKVKMAPGEETKSFEMTEILRRMLVELPEEAFAGKEMTDGKIELVIEPAKFLEIFDEYIASSTLTLKDMMKKDTLKAQDCKVSVSVKDGYIATYKISSKLTMKIDYAGADYDVEFAITDAVTINNPGSTVTFTAPTLSEYVG